IVDVHAGDEVSVARDLVEQVRRVPELPDVELDPDGAVVDLLDERSGFAERVQDRPALDSLQLKRLDGQSQAEPLRLPPDLAHAPHRPLTVTRAGEAQARGRRISRESFDPPEK